MYLIGAIIIGLTLGLLGSGGSILTVPVLTYLVGHETKVSIAESMAIVGCIALVGAGPYAWNRQVSWPTVLYFGIPGMLGTYAGAWLGGLMLDALQLVIFGAVLLLAAGLMFRRRPARSTESTPSRPSPEAWRSPKTDGTATSPARPLKIVAEGTLVGVITGIVGVGGGFLIVPALVLLAGLSMRQAIATSLVIIALKSAVGFWKYHHTLIEMNLNVDWQVIAVFCGVGIFGSLLGQQLGKRIDQDRLRRAFAVFLLVMGCFVVLKEGWNMI